MLIRLESLTTISPLSARCRLVVRLVKLAGFCALVMAARGHIGLTDAGGAVFGLVL